MAVTKRGILFSYL